MSQRLTGPPSPMLLKEWIPSAPRRKPYSCSSASSTSAISQLVVGSHPGHSMPAALPIRLRPPSHPTRYSARSDWPSDSSTSTPVSSPAKPVTSHSPSPFSSAVDGQLPREAAARRVRRYRRPRTSATRRTAVLAHALNTPYGVFVLATGGLATQALPLVRRGVEDWLAWWYLQVRPEQAGRFHDCADKSPRWHDTVH